MLKTCNRCWVSKPKDAFHSHPRTKDGRRGQCKECMHKANAAYRARQLGGASAERRRRYERELEIGSRTRVAPQKHGRDPAARKAASLRYFHDRRARTVLRTEFDRFVFDEAVRLRLAREKATGTRWSLDHVVPLNHATASGLHNGFNLQVVPLRWNELKKNRHAEPYWPIKQHR